MAIEQIDYKKCTKCGEKYPATLEFFHRDSHGKAGLKARCKWCTRAISRKWEQDKREGHIKKCEKCRKWHPKTDEHFYKDENGNYSKWCIKCEDRQKANMQKTVYKQRGLDNIKQRYPVGEQVVMTDKDLRTEGRITGHYDYFMTVKTKNYTTSIMWTNILTGYEKVKVI